MNPNRTRLEAIRERPLRDVPLRVVYADRDWLVAKLTEALDELPICAQADGTLERGRYCAHCHIRDCASAYEYRASVLEEPEDA